MPTPQSDLQLIRLLADRLERISADSIWAHRASGVRGALLRTMEQLQNNETPEPRSMRLVVSTAIHILSNAARTK